MSAPDVMAASSPGIKGPVLGDVKQAHLPAQALCRVFASVMGLSAHLPSLAAIPCSPFGATCLPIDVLPLRPSTTAIRPARLIHRVLAACDGGIDYQLQPVSSSSVDPTRARKHVAVETRCSWCTESVLKGRLLESRSFKPLAPLVAAVLAHQQP